MLNVPNYQTKTYVKASLDRIHHAYNSHTGIVDHNKIELDNVSIVTLVKKNNQTLFIRSSVSIKN